MITGTLCYLEQNGKLLMLHRVKKENDVNKDKWIGVGGGKPGGLCAPRGLGGNRLCPD